MEEVVKERLCDVDSEKIGRIYGKTAIPHVHTC